MKGQNTPECYQNFAMEHVMGGPLIVVDDEDAFGFRDEAVKHDYNNENNTKEVQNELHIANEKLAEFHEILEENKVLKNRNKELESQLAEKEEKMLGKTFSHLSISLDESPYEHILHLEEELKAVKAELSLAHNREEWFKQHISRSEFVDIDSKTNALRHIEMFSTDDENKKNSKLSRGYSNLKQENKNIILSNASHSGLKLNHFSKTSEFFTGPANAFTRHCNLASSVALSLPSRARFEREKLPSVSDTLDFTANAFSMHERNSAL